MRAEKVIKIGALLGAVTVMIGAFGAHGLETLLVDAGREATFETAVKYQFYHVFALMFVGMLMKYYNSRYLIWASKLFLLGILIFSGSLYVLSVTNYTVLGAITPIGGLAFIFGWFAMVKALGDK